MMKTTNRPKMLVQHHEGLRLEAYSCPAGILTIGWGHTGASTGVKVTESDKLNFEQACRLFDLDWAQVEQAANRLLADGIQKGVVSQARFDAYCSFVFNLGETKCRKYTLTKLLNAGADDDRIGEIWPEYSYAGERLRGLYRRRMGELMIALGLPWEVTDDDPQRPYRVELDTTWRTVEKWAVEYAARYPKPKPVEKKPIDPKSAPLEDLDVDQKTAKPLEKSERAKGHAREKQGNEAATIGGTISVGSAMTFIQELVTKNTTSKALIIIAVLGLGVFAYGMIKRHYGKAQKANGRATASQVMY